MRRQSNILHFGTSKYLFIAVLHYHAVSFGEFCFALFCFSFCLFACLFSVNNATLQININSMQLSFMSLTHFSFLLNCFTLLQSAVDLGVVNM